MRILFAVLLFLLMLPLGIGAQEFPRTMFKAEDIERARVNIERYQWAQTTYDALKARADKYRQFDHNELRAFVSEKTPFLTIACPNCGAGPWYWAEIINEGQTLRCRADGSTFDYDPTVTTEEWDIHGLLRYMRLEYVMLDLENLGFAWQIDRDPIYAEMARTVILEFARVYPGYRVNRVNANEYGDNDEYYGKIAGWKWRDGLIAGRVILTYDLVRDSGVFSDEENATVEEFLRYTLDHYIEGFHGKRLSEGRFPQDLGSTWWCIAAISAILRDDEGLRLSVELFENLMDPDGGLFLEDGTFYQATPNYNWGLLGSITGIPEILRGNVSPAVYDNPKCALLEKCYTWFLDALYPDGSIVAFNDAHVGHRPDPLASEVAFAVFRNPKALMNLRQLYGWDLGNNIVLLGDVANEDGLSGFLVDRSGLNRYGLFFRDPNVGTDTPSEPFSTQSTHLTGLRAMLLRDDGFPPRGTMATMVYTTFFPGEHMQPDYLGMTLFAHDIEMIGETGYPWNPRWALDWSRSSLAHHTVQELQPFEDDARSLAWHMTPDARIAEAGVPGHATRLLVMLPFEEGAPAVVDIFRVDAGLDEYTWTLRGRSDDFRLTGVETDTPFDVAEPLTNGRIGVASGAIEANWIFDGGRGLRVVMPLDGSSRVVVATSPPEQDEIERAHLPGGIAREDVSMAMRAHLQVRRSGPSTVYPAVHLPWRDESAAQTRVVRHDTSSDEIVALEVTRGDESYLLVHNASGAEANGNGWSLDGRIGIAFIRGGDLRSMSLAGGRTAQLGDYRLIAGPEGNAYMARD